ncbi:hypothetical protein HUT16_36645 [Kitasatospora sp. NA04385]|uniref:hypothetical protein n=1 Tax=Kitasatospora sp. NA04385 TaxID=2742135 RepID=UPI00158FBD00|nr:hypothetical protein [Kitasatospora sp. NA04385]QKW23899.1 hypothetical protein HUT16_36645 [Kitasatospora sp. NA04385]
MGVHGVAAAGVREARVDPLLADRVVEALLLVGLPVAHGGHGPGVHLFATGTDGSGGTADRERWPVTLRWLCSARLEDAAAAAGAGSGSPWPRTRQLVVNSVETALAEFLPALGLSATRTAPDGPTLVGPGEDAAQAAAGAGAFAAAPGASAGEPAAMVLLPEEVVAAVRRGAALAGLPLARHARAAGVALTACPPSPGADADADTVPVADAAWRSSPQLPDTPAVSTAVREAMHHAVGTALTACGLRTSWHRPPDAAPHLHVADR